jgi:hypothetical protein
MDSDLKRLYWKILGFDEEKISWEDRDLLDKYGLTEEDLKEMIDEFVNEGKD